MGKNKNQLWILRPRPGLPEGDNPWNPWYDKVFGFVVRAPSEQEARALAHSRAGDENRGEFLTEVIAKTETPWLDDVAQVGELTMERDALRAEVERLREALRRIDRHTNGSHERRRHFVANEIARSALTEGAPDD